jgi:hypothetical protein
MIDQFPFFTFAHGFDRQPYLLSELVDAVAV